MDAPVSRTAPDLLDEMTARYGARDFIIDGERRFTYAAFQAVVRKHAKGLLGIGVARGDRLAILMENQAE